VRGGGRVGLDAYCFPESSELGFGACVGGRKEGSRRLGSTLGMSFVAGMDGLDERPITQKDSRAVGLGSSVRFLLAAMISAGEINGGGTVVDADRVWLLNV
jgi:hypothetical protein